MMMADHPEGKLYYMKPESQQPEDRFLRFLVEQKLARIVEEEYQAGVRTYSRVLVPIVPAIPSFGEAVLEGMLEGLIEGPHGGEIINLYEAELMLIAGINVAEAVRNNFKQDADENDEARYMQLMRLSTELFFRSCCEIVLLATGIMNLKES